MANIVNPQAIQFANAQARMAADRLIQSYYFAIKTIDQWNAFGGAALIPNTTDVIVDGAAVDGRQIITGAMVNNIINRLTEQKTDFTAASNAKLNTILQVAVNIHV